MNPYISAPKNPSSHFFFSISIPPFPSPSVFSHSLSFLPPLSVPDDGPPLIRKTKSLRACFLSAARISVSPTRTASTWFSAKKLYILRRPDSALCHKYGAPVHQLPEPQGVCEVYLERAQIAVIDSNNIGPCLCCHSYFPVRMGFHQGAKAQSAADAHIPFELFHVQREQISRTAEAPSTFAS